MQIESFAQNDVTDLYLTNAGFNTNCNYISGDSGTVATTDPSNAHTITGWSVAAAGAWSAAATFEFGWNGTFNGVATPASGSDGSQGSGQGAIGLTAGWGADLAYSQQVTLPAGRYTIEITSAFLGANDIAANLTGWIGNDGNVVLSAFNSAATLGSWYTDTVPLRLVTETTGTIQVGMRPYQSGSTSNARVFVDYVKLISMPVDKVELQALVDSANVMLANPEPVPEGSTVYADLNTAVTNAQAVLDDQSATTETILATEDDMKAAIADVHAAIFEASLTVYDNHTATYTSLTDENMQLTGTGQVTLTSSTDPMINSAIDLASPDAWVYFENMRPAEVVNSYLTSIKANGEDAVPGTNIRVTNYLNGAMVIAHSSTYAAATVFDGASQSGSSMDLLINQYYKTTELGSMNDNIESFVLKRGYMATFASNEDGTGTSRVYIADDEDIIVNLMPTGLSNTASMVVVRQWRWTTKKGWRGSSSDADRFNAGSHYDYNNTSYGTLDVEYVPMRHNPNWNAYGNFLDKFGSTHALGYNEPDNPVDDGYSTVADAIAAWPNMMASGLRLGSPATTDGGLSWTYDFIDQCDALGYRVDFVAWHFYRAGYTAQQLYDQLLAVHNRTGRPLWITEFNNGCNWTYNGNEPSEEENAQVIAEFIAMLEDAPFVERYYVWDGCNESLRMTNYDGTLKPAGVVYRDQVSTMAYSADYYNNCEPATITPWFQINGGSWTASTDVTVNAGDEIRFGPQPLDGTWSWSGCGTSGSSREQVIYPTSSCSATATHTTVCGAQSSVTYNVTVGSSENNAAPVASFTFTTTDLTANFDASGSSDSDGSIVSYDWDFGDGNVGTGQTTGHTYTASGDYTVTLTVTDDSSATGTDQQVVSVSGGPASLIYVESIVTSTSNVGKGNKVGTAQVSISDDQDGQVAGATVNGTFSGTYNETVSGVTGADGVVSFQTTGTAKGGVTVNFCVDDVTHSNLTYDPSQNQITCTGSSSRQAIEEELSGEKVMVTVYPNPVKDQLHLSGIEEVVDLNIFSLAGKNMKGHFSLDDHVVEVGGLAPGVYFLKVKFNDQQNLMKRFIKIN